MKTTQFLAAVFCCAFGSSVAQNSDTLQLKVFEVQENRLAIQVNQAARNITIIAKEAIVTSNAGNVNELLQFVQSVDVRQRGVGGAQADISLRGGTFEQTLVLLNGIKLSDPQTGHHTLNLPINLNNIERIEVIRGGAARVYGQNAFNGAINIVTKTSGKNELFVSGEGGSYGSYNGSVTLNTKHKKFEQFIALNQNGANGYRENSDFRVSSVFYEGKLALNNQQSLTANAGYSNRYFGANGFYASPNFTQQWEAIETTFASLRYLKEGSSSKFRVNAYFRRNSDHYLLFRLNPEIYENKHFTNVSGIEAHYSKQSKFGVTGIGLETRLEQINSTNLGNHQRLNTGLFLEHKWVSKNAKLLVIPGVYVNYYSDYGVQAFPGIEASYAMGTSTSVYGSVSRSFRVPTYTDLYYVGPTNVGNANLQPEEAINSELGFKWLKNAYTFQSAVFWRSANSLIDWVRQTENEPWVPQNFYSANFYGVELQSTLQLNKLLNVKGNSSLALQYTYIETALNNSQNILTRYALDNLQQQAILTYTQSFLKKAYFTVGLRYADRVTYKDYALLNCKIGYQSNGFNLFVNGSNLTNTEYVEAGYVSMPGMWLSGGFSYNFNLKK